MMRIIETLTPKKGEPLRPLVLYVLKSPLFVSGRVDVRFFGDILVNGVPMDGRHELDGQLTISPSSKHAGVYFRSLEVAEQTDLWDGPLPYPEEPDEPEFALFEQWAQKLGLVRPGPEASQSSLADPIDELEDDWDLPLDTDSLIEEDDVDRAGSAPDPEPEIVSEVDSEPPEAEIDPPVEPEPS